MRVSYIHQGTSPLLDSGRKSAFFKAQFCNMYSFRNQKSRNFDLNIFMTCKKSIFYAMYSPYFVQQSLFCAAFHNIFGKYFLKKVLDYGSGDVPLVRLKTNQLHFSYN